MQACLSGSKFSWYHFLVPQGNIEMAFFCALTLYSSIFRTELNEIDELDQWALCTSI